MIRSFFVAALLIVCVSGSTFASTYALHRAVEDGFQYDAANYTLEARTALALAQDRYWSDFLQKMPDLSQGEQDKVIEGIRSTDDFRHAEAMTSKNGLIFLSRDSVEKCRLAAAELYPTVGGAAKAEAAAWVKLIKCFDNVSRLPFLLKGAGLIKEENYLQPYYMQGVSSWSSRTVGVLERLLMEWP